jgi:hypothetical protein
VEIEPQKNVASVTRKEYDLPQRVFDFKKDLSFGHQGESLVTEFLDSLSSGSFEVKTDRYRNGRMIVETNQNPKGIRNDQGEQIWVASGINVTTAKWWVYVFALDGSFVMVDTSRLKRYLRINKHKFNESTKKSLGGADNPARGFLLMANDVQDLLINQEYDSETE